MKKLMALKLKRTVSWADRLTINMKGGTWLGIFTLTMWAGAVNAMFLGGPDIPNGVILVYGTIVTVFGGTKVAGKLINGKNGQPVEED